MLTASGRKTHEMSGRIVQWIIIWLPAAVVAVVPEWRPPSFRWHRWRHSILSIFVGPLSRFYPFVLAHNRLSVWNSPSMLWCPINNFVYEWRSRFALHKSNANDFLPFRRSSLYRCQLWIYRCCWWHLWRTCCQWAALRFLFDSNLRWFAPMHLSIHRISFWQFSMFARSLEIRSIPVNWCNREMETNLLIAVVR